MDHRLRLIADHLMALKAAAEFAPASIDAKLLPHLFILDIERKDAGAAHALRIRLTGTAIDNVFHRALQGRKLEEFIHGPHGAKVIESFRHCADTREPVWMRQIVHMTGRMPRFVEGVAIYLDPERIYGGLIVGDYAESFVSDSFERLPITGG